MLKYLFVLFVFASVASAQNAIQKLVDAEHAFAQLAAEKGTKAAFLANMADGAVVFEPERTDARTVWEKRAASKSLLSWAPNFADISSDGKIGYTTGNWEYRPKGKDDKPVAFGDFITVWRLQPDGNYKWVIDIGVSHDKPLKYSTDWLTSTHRGAPKGAQVQLNSSIAGFAAVAKRSGMAAAYQKYAGEQIRSYREGRPPILGKSSVTKGSDADQRKISVDITSKPVGDADLAYLLTGYTSKGPNGEVERGNDLQIWEYYNGKWRLVLDILKPVPTK